MTVNRTRKPIRSKTVGPHGLSVVPSYYLLCWDASEQFEALPEWEGRTEAAIARSAEYHAAR